MTKCNACLKKVDEATIKNGVCPECYEKEKNMTERSPLKAVLMSILPGAGHKFYLGQDKKGSAILLLAFVGVLFWPLLFMSWFYAGMDAYAQAKRINKEVQNG